MDDRTSTPCLDLRDQLLAAARPLGQLELALPECRVRIAVDDPGVLAELRDYFSEFLAVGASVPVQLDLLALQGPTPPLPGALTIKEDDKGRPSKEAWIDLADGRIVHKIRTGVVIVMGEGVELIAGPIRGHVDQVVNFVNHRLMARWVGNGGVLAHAAGIARGGRGLVLCGTSGAGKSTLALHMMAADPSLAFVSNDRAVLDRGDAADGGETAKKEEKRGEKEEKEEKEKREREEKMPRILGIPKQPRVNPGTILHNPSLASMISDAERARYAAMPTEELRFLEEKRDAMIERLFGGGHFCLEARAVGLVILRWTPDGGAMRVARVSLEGRRDLLAILHKRLGLFFWPLPSASVEADHAALTEVLAGVPVYEVSGGVDFDAAAAWAGRLLDGGDEGGDRGDAAFG